MSDQGLTRRWLLGSVAMFAVVAWDCRWARGQTAPAATVAQAGNQPANNGAIEDVIVTATKQSRRLQDVPVSVAVLGQKTLEQHQVTSLDDYIKLLPSVSYQSYGPGQSQLFFRGITSGGDGGYGAHAGSPPTSGVYLDEVPVTTIGNSVDLHIYDIDRVEALSGPQGTLFGASSLAGTLRIITNQPDPRKFAAGYDLEGTKYGDGGPGGIEQGYVNIPITDKVAIRLVAFDEHDGGYINNEVGQRTYTLGGEPPADYITVNNKAYAATHFNDIDTFGGRAALRVDLDDDWSITPGVIYQNQTANGTFLYDPKKGDLNVTDYAPDLNTDRWYQSYMTIKGKIADWDVVYAFGYFNRVVETQADYSYYTVAYDKIPGYNEFRTAKGTFLDPTQYFRGRDSYTKHTEELRFVSPQSDRLRFLLGGFYQRQTDEIHGSFAVNGVSSIPDSPAIPTLGDSIYGTHIWRTDRDYAAFGEAAFDILPDLTLTGGFRGFIADNNQFGFTGFQSAESSPVCLPTQRTDIPCANVNRGVYERGETHKVNLAWKIDHDKMVYFTYSTGFRPGGVNRREGVADYAPDTLINYEVGAKTSWLNHSLFIDGAAFIDNWNNLQYGLPSLGSNGVISIYNAGNAVSRGFEAQTTWRATDTLTLSGAATYVDAHLTTNFCGFNLAGNVDCSQGIAAPAGTRLPIQPRWKMNATARQDFDFGPYTSFVQGSTLFQTGTRSWLTDREADLLGSTGDFATFDFSAGITRDNWKGELFIQNAFNRRAALSLNTVCVPTICGQYARVYPVRPQYFGFRFSQNF